MLKISTLFFLACLWGLPFAAAAVEVGGDVTMTFIGYLSPSSDGKVTPGEYDTVLLVNEKTGKTEATAVYDAAGGVYWIQIDKPASFNGTILLPRLSQSSTVYKLLNEGRGDARLTFDGGTGFGIKTLKINLVATSAVIGSTTPGGTTTPGSTTPGSTTPGSTTPGGTTGGSTGSAPPPPPVLSGDINGDNKIDELDIQLLKQGLSGQTADTPKMDVNGDKVTNTRDLIDLIRLVRTQAQAVQKTPKGTTTREQIDDTNLVRAQAQADRKPVSIITKPTSIIPKR